MIRYCFGARSLILIGIWLQPTYDHSGGHKSMSGGMNKNDNTDARVAEGYDIPAVEAWIDANTDYFKPPFSWTRLEGGHSNLTYRLADESGK